MHTTSFDVASAWAQELYGTPNFLQFWFPRQQFIEAHGGTDWMSATRHDGDALYGMAVGKNAEINPRWTHFSVSRFANQDQIDKESFEQDGEWDAFTIRTERFAHLTALENLNTSLDEVEKFLDRNFPDASTRTDSKEVLSWAALRNTEGRLVAVGALSQWESGYLAAQSITVAQEERGKGYGRKITEGMVATAYHLGFDSLCLGVWYHNAVAKKLYEDIGFNRVESFLHYSRIDDAVARRNRPQATIKKPTVLFVCVHNAGRSQMAAGYMSALSGGKVEVLSAGSAPKDSINPIAIAAMAEEGIDISANQPKVLTTEAVMESDVVITMGCGDACPFFPGKRYEDWVLDDPAGQELKAVRVIRDEIKKRVEALLADLL